MTTQAVTTQGAFRGLTDAEIAAVCGALYYDDAVDLAYEYATNIANQGYNVQVFDPGTDGMPYYIADSDNWSVEWAEGSGSIDYVIYIVFDWGNSTA